MGTSQEKSKRSGQSLRDQFNSIGLTDLSPASVVAVRDEKLSFPHNLFRKAHQRRFAVVLSNDVICASKHHPLIVIVPMTHNVEVKSETDVLIDPDNENGLLHKSHAQLHLIQPVLKSEVLEKMGVLRNRDWEKILETFVWMTDRA